MSKPKKKIDYLGQGFLDSCPSLSPHLQYFILNVLDVYMRCVHLQSFPSPRQESCSTFRSHSASCGWRPDAPPHSSNLGKTDFMADRRIHRQRNFSIFCTTSREHMSTSIQANLTCDPKEQSLFIFTVHTEYKL